MKLLALAAAAAVTAASFLVSGAAPARANAFCPVTIAAVTNLAILGRADTYGVMLDLDPSDVASVRLRVDSTTTRYAVDISDLGPVGAAPIQAKRYFRLAPGDQLVSAWIESTGTSPDARLECPITRPYAAGAPAPIDPRVVRETTVAETALRDSYSTKTPVLPATSFGNVQPQTCPAPYAPARRPCTPTASRSCASSSTRRAASCRRASSDRPASLRSTSPHSRPHAPRRIARRRSTAARWRVRISSRCRSRATDSRVAWRTQW
jgi:hypothetical protein